MKIKKIGSIIILIIIYIGLFSFPLFFNGCSITTPLFSSRDNKASLIVEKPPMRIIISGEYTTIKTEELIRVMKELRKHKYHNYNFDDTIIIDSEHATMHKDEYNTIRKNN